MHCTCQLRNMQLIKTTTKKVVKLNEPISHYLSVRFHGFPSFVVKLKRLQSVITQVSEDHFHSPLEHSRDGADSRPHLCHWPVQVGLVQRSLTELLWPIYGLCVLADSVSWTTELTQAVHRRPLFTQFLWNIGKECRITDMTACCICLLDMLHWLIVGRKHSSHVTSDPKVLNLSNFVQKQACLKRCY